MLFLSITFQSLGYALICAWILDLPESATGKSGYLVMESAT